MSFTWDQGGLTANANSPTFDVVKDYGADPTGINDSRPAIQRAWDDAQAAALSLVKGVNVRPTVIHPRGVYRCDAPLFLGGAGITIRGTGRNSTYLAKSDITHFWFGPGIVASQDPHVNDPTTTPPPYVASLVPGAGRAWDLASTGSSSAYFLPLDWIGATKALNGATQFCCEFYVRQDNNQTSVGGNVISSFGTVSLGTNPGVNDVLNSCFQMFIGGPGILKQNKPIGRLNIGGSIVALTGNALSLGTVTHVALDYDGTTVRLFQAGTLIASQAASGTVTQSTFESVTLGPSFTGYPAGAYGIQLAGALATVDSIRIGTTSQYTSNFSPPTTKLAAVAGTVFLLNFETFDPSVYQQGYWCKGSAARAGVGISPAYFYPLTLVTGGFGATSFYDFSAPGLYTQGCVLAQGGNLDLSGSQGWGLWSTNNGFQSNFDLIFTQTNATIGQSGGIVNTFGPNKYSKHYHTGTGTAIAGWGFELDTSLYNPACSIVSVSGNINGHSGGDFIARRLAITDEGSGSIPTIFLYLGGARAKFYDCAFDRQQSAGPIAHLSGPSNALQFFNCEFNTNPGAAAILEQSGATGVYDVVVYRPYYWNSGGGPNGVPLAIDPDINIVTI